MQTDNSRTAASLLAAVKFAADKHRNQRRKDPDALPYINHPIAVAEVLARGGIEDLVTLQAAILHDTIEDTETSPFELEEHFGPEVRTVVEEVTDDKTLPKEKRKRLQIDHASKLSDRARLVKLGDKICNVYDVTHSPPSDWPLERREGYLDWTEQVIRECRGVNTQLEEMYDQLLVEGRQALIRKTR